MSNGKQPWLDRWKVEQQLGKGGQGAAVLVSSVSDPSVRGVLKTLNRDYLDQTRSRMRREVVNLDVLSKAGLKVPPVLDGNTEDYDKRGVPLSFVMGYVVGNTLDKEVKERGPLPLDKAAEITLDLEATVAAAHRQDVLHRDLKPDNVMVRGFDPADLVIVDYGLSFNQGEDGDAETLTNSDEQFRNRFLALPETNTPGGDRRDRRSDITALSAILYFCLTGHNPGHLRDGGDKTPHRRPGVGVRPRLEADPRCQGIEAVLDRGFAADLENRFQTCDEFVERLQAVLTPPAAEEDPIAVSAELGGLLRTHDRKTRLADYATYANEIRHFLHTKVMEISRGLDPAFVLSAATGRSDDADRPNDVAPLGETLSITLTLGLHRLSVIVLLRVGVKGEQCVLLRAVGGVRVRGEKRSRDRRPARQPNKVQPGGGES